MEKLVKKLATPKAFFKQEQYNYKHFKIHSDAYKRITIGWKIS